MNVTNLRRCERLYFSRRPSNHHLLDVRFLTQTEMQAALILRPKSAAARDLLHLVLAHSRRAAPAVPMALRLLTLPSSSNAIHLLSGVTVFLYSSNGPFLIDDHDIQYATVPEIGQRHGTAIVGVSDANHLRHIKELPGAIVDPHVSLLIT